LMLNMFTPAVVASAALVAAEVFNSERRVKPDLLGVI
jgi:hypothetical protein